MSFLKGAMPDREISSPLTPKPNSIWQAGEVVGWFGALPRPVGDGAHFPQLIMGHAFKANEPFRVGNIEFLLRAHQPSIPQAPGHGLERIYINALCDVLTYGSDPHTWVNQLPSFT